MERDPEAGDLDGVHALGGLVARTAGPQPGRRVFHAVNGLLIFALLRFTPIGRVAAVGLIGGLFVGAVAVDLVRLRFRTLNVLFFRTFIHLASPREERRIASSTWYLGGIALAISLFPRAWAEAAVLVLALADPIAGWVGRRWGGARRLGTGTWLGSSAFLVVTTALLTTVTRPSAAILAALIVTAVEALPWPLDDNLTIPLAACAALLLVGA